MDGGIFHKYMVTLIDTTLEYNLLLGNIISLIKGTLEIILQASDKVKSVLNSRIMCRNLYGLRKMVNIYEIDS